MISTRRQVSPMLRSDELILISESDAGRDANGFALPRSETRRTVYCDVRSVSVSEFYAARTAGYTASLKAIMYADEYLGEQIAEHDGKRMRIIRTYMNGQDIELTLTELSERCENGED